MADRSIDVVVTGNAAMTRGFASGDQVELVARATQLTDVAQLAELIRFVARYLSEEGRVLREGETIAYGTWLLKAVREGAELVLHEFDGRTGDFKPTISIATRLRAEQQEVCQQHALRWEPPMFHQKVAVSEGYSEAGAALDGVRYNAPSHMSGWYITTDSYSGDIRELRGIHAWHAAYAGHDVGRLLALPPGTRFRREADGRLSVWFDEKVASQPA